MLKWSLYQNTPELWKKLEAAEHALEKRAAIITEDGYRDVEVCA